MVPICGICFWSELTLVSVLEWTNQDLIICFNIYFDMRSIYVQIIMLTELHYLNKQLKSWVFLNFFISYGEKNHNYKMISCILFLGGGHKGRLLWLRPVSFWPTVLTQLKNTHIAIKLYLLILYSKVSGHVNVSYYGSTQLGLSISFWTSALDDIRWPETYFPF